MKIFISSTYRDLKDYRKAAIDAIERLGQHAERMEIFGAKPIEPLEACLNEVDSCDLFIGIYAYRYGFIPQGARFSITQLEYKQAIKSKKPVFCFIIDENLSSLSKEEDETGKTKLERFKSQIKRKYIVERFTTPDDLGLKVAASIGKYLISLQSNLLTNNPYLSQLKINKSLFELLENSIQILCKITKTDYNQIFLLTTETYTRQLICVADNIPQIKQRYRVALFTGLIGKTLQTGITINANNVEIRPDYRAAVIETKSELVVPIIQEGIVYGVINSESEEISYYTKKMQKLAEYLGYALGYSLPNAGWYPEIEIEKLPWIRENR